MKNDLFLLGFVENPQDKNNLICTINGYSINVNICENDFSKSTIDYGSKILVSHKSVCNFSKPENFVQLECIIRLLSKGYKPNCIELEKT